MGWGERVGRLAWVCGIRAAYRRPVGGGVFELEFGVVACCIGGWFFGLAPVRAGARLLCGWDGGGEPCVGGRVEVGWGWRVGEGCPWFVGSLEGGGVGGESCAADFFVGQPGDVEGAGGGFASGDAFDVGEDSGDFYGGVSGVGGQLGEGDAPEVFVSGGGV